MVITLRINLSPEAEDIYKQFCSNPPTQPTILSPHGSTPAEDLAIGTYIDLTEFIAGQMGLPHATTEVKAQVSLSAYVEPDNSPVIALPGYTNEEE